MRVCSGAVPAGTGNSMRGDTRLLIRVGDALGTLFVAACAAYALGELFIWLWAPTPTPDNASPPPEAFLFVWGDAIGFFGVLLARWLLAALWLRHRRRLGWTFRARPVGRCS